MQVCSNCHATVSDGLRFCPECGAKLFTQPYVQRAPATGQLHCPQCKSVQLSPVVESTVNGGFTTHSRSGAFSTTKVSNTHRNYWMCSNCGNKFRNIQNLQEEIERCKNTPMVCTIFTVISAIFSLILIIKVMNDPVAAFFLSFLTFVSVVATIVFGVYIFVSKSKLEKMKEELNYLMLNCFN